MYSEANLHRWGQNLLSLNPICLAAESENFQIRKMVIVIPFFYNKAHFIQANYCYCYCFRKQHNICNIISERYTCLWIHVYNRKEMEKQTLLPT